MNSPKTYLIALLALTTVGGAALAWHQYGELVELRAAAMNRDERADMQARVAELEKANRELQDQLAVFQNPETEMDLLARDDRPGGNRADRGDRSQRGESRNRDSDGRQQMTALRELMSKPEVQAMLSVQQKAAIEQRYAALFKNLNLSAEQSDKLKTLLAERGNTRRDVEEAARAQGISPRENPEAYRKLFADAQNELNNNIKSVIGEQGLSQLQTYERTLPQRNLVENLQQRLSYSDTPLTSAQAEQLVQILATNSPQRSATTTPGQTPPMGNLVIRRPDGIGGRGPDGIGFGGGMMPGLGDGNRGGASVTAAAVSQAQTILAPPQLAALQKIQQQQQAQQHVQQLVRDTLAANQPAAKSTTATANGAANQPRRRDAKGGK